MCSRQIIRSSTSRHPLIPCRQRSPPNHWRSSRQMLAMAGVLAFWFCVPLLLLLPLLLVVSASLKQSRSFTSLSTRVSITMDMDSPPDPSAAPHPDSAIRLASTIHRFSIVRMSTPYAFVRRHVACRGAFAWFTS